MIRSMTGFGRGEYTDGKRSFTVEVRSVNHRYCDINVRMPKRYSFAEETVKKVVKEYVSRGKIEVGITVEAVSADDIAVQLNEAAAGQYLENLKLLKQKFDLSGDITLELLSGMPDVLKTVPSVEDEDEIMTVAAEAVKRAMKAHSAMREIEGAKLASDLSARGDKISSSLNFIKSRAPKLQREYAEGMRERIKEILGGEIEVPEERVILEAAIFADKASIAEEVVRLDSHIAQMADILEKGGVAGKKLDFLVQEMNREANTIGSKANDLEITTHMLDIKAEVEKIREQVQNIE